MPIEFSCPSCGKTLRVPDDAGGKHAKCPNCGTIQVVPGGAASLPTAQSTPPWSFGEPFAGGPPRKESSYDAGREVNPYAPSAPVTLEPKAAGPDDVPITNQRPSIEDIMGHAWQIWKENLGLLVGVTLVAGAISLAIDIPRSLLQNAMAESGEQEMALLVVVVGTPLSSVVNLFVGIGVAQISLKLARRQPAEFAELFGGGQRFWPVLGGWLLATVAYTIGLLLCIVPGIILALMFWPFYYLLVDGRAKVFESYSLAQSITEGNWGTTFILALVSFGVMIVGVLAFCIGVLFAAPLVTMIWATAYLMMSGQLSPGGFKPVPAPAI